MVIEHFYPDRPSLFSALSEYCIDAIKKRIDNLQKPTVYLSGGSTPAPLYDLLSTSALNFTAINWAMVDERWVDGDSQASNYRFIQRCFHRSDGFSLIPMKNSAATPQEGLIDLEKRYSQLPRQSTLCILGMGSDAHTASFFPHSQGLETALMADNPHRVAAITAKESEVTGAFVERVTLTLETILSSDTVILLITGDDKFKVYQQALSCTDSAIMPVSAVLNEPRKSVHVFWSP